MASGLTRMHHGSRSYRYFYQKKNTGRIAVQQFFPVAIDGIDQQHRLHFSVGQSFRAVITVGTERNNSQILSEIPH